MVRWLDLIGGVGGAVGGSENYRGDPSLCTLLCLTFGDVVYSRASGYKMKILRL